MILEELQKTASHPSAVELYERVRRRLPKISLGTVYRNLELLAAMGKIQKLDLAGGEARFDANLDPHGHVRCVRCGRVDDVEGPLPTAWIEQTGEAAGYEVLGHRLELLGLCPECQGPPGSHAAAPLPEAEGGQPNADRSGPS
jgi:Fur family ferric uptake transcriptional regulator